MVGPSSALEKQLKALSFSGKYLYRTQELLALLGDKISPEAGRMVLSRLVRKEILFPVVRGVYLYPFPGYPKDLILYRTVEILRGGHWNYLSLETVLSLSGRISQIPLGRIMVMTTGRSGLSDCGAWGSIEFIHTQRDPAQILPRLLWNPDWGMFYAPEDLALEDYRLTRRDPGLLSEDL